MPRNSSGEMTLSGVFAPPNQIAVSADVNAKIDDILAEISDSLSRDGKGGMRAPLVMGGYKITGLGNGSAAGDAAAYGQIQTSTANQATSVTGTGDAIEASFTPSLSSLTTGLALRVIATAANTITAPTIDPDGLGTRTIKKLNGAALAAGDIAGAGHVLSLIYNGTDFMLLNPAGAAGAPLDSPPLTGNPTAPTAAIGDDDTSIATTAFVNRADSMYFALNEQTGTTYTFVATDPGKLVSGENAAAQVYTVPLNATTPIDVKKKIDLYQKGAGQITLVGALGVTLISKNSALKLSARYAAVTLVKVATDTWFVFGDLTT